jgi:hypothetical protein
MPADLANHANLNLRYLRNLRAFSFEFRILLFEFIWVLAFHLADNLPSLLFAIPIKRI